MKGFTIVLHKPSKSAGNYDIRYHRLCSVIIATDPERRRKGFRRVNKSPKIWRTNRIRYWVMKLVTIPCTVYWKDIQLRSVCDMEDANRKNSKVIKRK